MLFERTAHMALVCADLMEMVDIVDDFFKFLGPELKAVIGMSPAVCTQLITLLVRRCQWN